MRLKGKRALVTGAAGGIGAAIALRLDAEGADVFVADLKDNLPLPVGRRTPLALDVAASDDWNHAAALIRRSGTLDILVNNAGVNTRRGILESEFADFERMIAINLFGSYHGMRAMLPFMPRGASIINIASLAGMEAHAFALYSTSKWALRGLSKCAAAEFAPHGIRVNAICPGLVVTNINRMHAYIEALAGASPLGACETEDIAAAAAWLASDDSRRVTGQDIVVDGGLGHVNGFDLASARTR